MRLEEFAEQGGDVFANVAIIGAEGGEGVGVDIKFASDFAMNEDGDNNFRFGFEGTGEIAGVGIDVVDDDGFAGGGCGATDTLIERNASVGSRSALEGPQDEGIGVLLQHVKADPVIVGQLFVEESDDPLHENFGRSGRFCESIEIANQVGCFGG